jgi:hypothetical protein
VRKREAIMALGRSDFSVLAAATVLLSVFAVCRGDMKNGASFVFGDSLVDSGNNNYLPTLSKADIRPNGIDFKAFGGKPTGRFTNGKTIADISGTKYSDFFVFFFLKAQ